MPEFNSVECLKQREKNLVMNAYMNGTWGSYRFTPMQTKGNLQTHSCIVAINIRSHLVMK